jgi:thioredoxin-like negative regulator of GroEL
MEQGLREAILLIRKGNITQGRHLLVEILQGDPKNEEAWMLMSKCVIDPELKQYCYERVLTINPANQEAISAIH